MFSLKQENERQHVTATDFAWDGTAESKQQTADTGFRGSPRRPRKWDESDEEEQEGSDYRMGSEK